MARIICIRPIDSYEAKECVRNKFSGMLIQILANLRPDEELEMVRQLILKEQYQGMRSTIRSYVEQSCLAKGINQSGIEFMFSTLGQMSH